MAEDLCCWNCRGQLAGVPLPISRHAYCEQCSEALHCCKLCIYYDRDKVDQCDEDRAEHPTNKETANFCEYFKPSANLFELPDGPDKARSQLDSLFDADTSTVDTTGINPGSSEAESRLNSLFDD